MTRAEAWLMHISTILVGGTGLVYGWMKYVSAPDDPFAVVGHPWQPTFQHLHIWVAPLLVFAAGVLWRNHIWRHLEKNVRARRTSGLLLLVTLVPMVVSGYLIQTTVTDLWRTTWVVVHCVTSALWLLGHAIHVLVPLYRRRAKRRQRTSAMPPPERSPEPSPEPDYASPPVRT